MIGAPSELGYRMPAEWEPHAATWLTWPPRDPAGLQGSFDTIPEVYGEFIRVLASSEPVAISVWDAAAEAEARAWLTERKVPLESISFHHFPAYSPWCRDHGPTWLVRLRNDQRERAVIDWTFNGWGERYQKFDQDDLLPQHIARLREVPFFCPGIVLEGGAIDSNGQGTLLTTESCLLNPNRNPRLGQKDLSQHLRDFLGATQVLWLAEGLVGDDADGHVDNVARFLNPTTIAVVVEANLDDANYQPLRENFRRVRSFRDQKDRLFRVVKLPTPGFVEHHGQRLPASYANFYVANTVVIVPTFRKATDREVLTTFRTEFPKHKVVGLDASELIWGLGAFHSLAQPEPA